MKKYFFYFFNALYTPKGNKKNYDLNYILKTQNDDTPYSHTLFGILVRSWFLTRNNIELLFYLKMNLWLRYQDIISCLDTTNIEHVNYLANIPFIILICTKYVVKYEKCVSWIKLRQAWLSRATPEIHHRIYSNVSQPRAYALRGLREDGSVVLSFVCEVTGHRI